MKRAIWIVLDSVGIGAMPDSNVFGDGAVNTLSHTYTHCQSLDLKNMVNYGLGKIGRAHV